MEIKQDSLDVLWVLVAAAMVLLMQLGFLFLETGLVRSKNSISVAVKNVLDFCVAALVFWALGFGLMFGRSWNGVLGGSDFLFQDMEDARRVAFFLFQVVFCGTAATIVSGAVAERTRFSVYLAMTCFIALIIYPVFGHWAWGGLMHTGSAGWLQRLGFIDFAGSTVVHSVGAWTALAGAIVVGPRLGAFASKDEPIRPSNLTISAAGTILLWFAWWGFNGGSTLAVNGLVPKILLNTNLAAAAGGLAGCAYGAWRSQGERVSVTLNGVIAGLVSVTASCHALHPGLAVLVGAVGAVIAGEGATLLRRWRVDDAVGAISVHGLAGVWGTLAVSMGDPQFFLAGRGHWTQLGVQAIGVVAAFCWSFPLMFGALWLLRRFRPVRVSPEAERAGLNLAEHGASSDLLDLFTDIQTNRLDGDVEAHVRVEPHTEVGQLAAEYNRMVDHVASEIEAREAATETAIRAKLEAERATLAKDRFLANMSHEIRTPMNGVVGMIDVLRESHPPLGEEQQRCAEVAGACAKDLMVILNDILDLTRLEHGQIQLEAIPFELASVVEQTVELHAENANRKGIDLYCWIYEDVPPVLVGDPTRLRQVFSNLVSNAIKFTEKGEVTLRISCAAREGDAVTLDASVDDTGVGISPDAQKRIFEAFAQEDNSTTRRFGGSGLGLTIARKIVESMDGRLAVQSTVGRGTSFSFKVHLRVAEAASGTKVPERTLGEVVVLTRNRKLLCALGHMLDARATSFRLAEPGEDFAAAGRPGPDLIFVDEALAESAAGREQLRASLESTGGHVFLLRKVLSDARPEWVPRGRPFTVVRRPLLPSLLFRKIEAVREAGRAGELCDPVVADRPEDRETSEMPPLRILLVEDLLMNKVVAEKLLGLLGQEISAWAKNGQEAIDLLRVESFDVVFMDCQMPEMDGFEATSQIRAGMAGEDRVDVPIVAMTANALAGDRDRCLRSGMNDYVSKPLRKVEVERILGQVAEALGSRLDAPADEGV